MNRFSVLATALALCVMAVMTGAASAHPHVFVDARAEIVFTADGRIGAVRNIWQFDEAFSAYATVNLDADNDGQLSDAELEPLAKINVESLQEFAFFTYLTVGDKEAEFIPPTEYFLTYDGARLTLYYMLPLMEPVAVTTPATLEVFDPEYFVAFTFVQDEPARLVDAPDGCTATFHAPQELDAQTMAVLNAIPADQRTIPDDLVAAASVLANVVVVDCSAAKPALAAAAESQPPEPPKPKPASPFGIATPDSSGTGWIGGPLGPFFVWVGQRQAEFYRALTSSFADIKSDGRAAWLLLAVSFLYGIFHAAGPGHGKAVITSYLFATGETVRRGIGISFAAAFVQALSAILIVAVAVLVFRVVARTMTVATQWIEIGSYALIVLVGLWLVWTKTFRGGHHHHHHHFDAGGDTHDHGDHVDIAQARPARRIQWEKPGRRGAVHADAHDHVDDHGDHHGHPHGHDHGHHHHAPPRARASLMATLSAILAVGVRPCSGAIIVLVFAISQGMFAVGIASTLVMALGTGITVALLATLAVSARGFALRLAGTDSAVAYRTVRGLEILAAFLVLGLGVVLLGGAVANGLPVA